MHSGIRYEMGSMHHKHILGTLVSVHIQEDTATNNITQAESEDAYLC
jgi:hypothetical protein